MLDRIDIQIELPSMSYDELAGSSAPIETSQSVRERVVAARQFAAERMSGESGIYCNAQMSSAEIRKYCVLDGAATALIKAAYDRLGMSARGYDRILRVARTIADLDGMEVINDDHIAEAIMYRTLDRKYWRR
jgi:magnesium chelatase family protein